MTDWQTIDSAPRDGTKILAYSEADGVHVTEYYVIEKRHFEALGGNLFRAVDNSDGDWNSNNPTHWMRLPPPPEDSQ